MGGGSYSQHRRATRSKSLGFKAASATNNDKYFKNNVTTGLHKSMDLNGVIVRESRDSEEHPESYSIILVLDGTGSMGSVPAVLLKDGIPSIIQRLFDAGISNPQVSFVVIGDHITDKFPLQASQFESSDELIDECLLNCLLEKRGGGNNGESYSLAWYHAANHTSIDCFEKRGIKGTLISIGDEPFHMEVPGNVIKRIYGMDEEPSGFNSVEILQKAKETYNVHHINVNMTRNGSIEKKRWIRALRDNYHTVDSSGDISDLITQIVLQGQPTLRRTTPKSDVQTSTDITEML